MQIDLTDNGDLLELENRFRCEAERILAWAKIFKEKGESGKIPYSENMHRCRRLNKMAAEIKALRESY